MKDDWEIKVTEDDIIRNIQRAFHKMYPLLKMQFLRNPSQEGNTLTVKEHLSPLLPIEEVTMFHASAIIDVSPYRTIGELKYDFFHELGLNIEIMQLSDKKESDPAETDKRSLIQYSGKEETYHIFNGAMKRQNYIPWIKPKR